MNPSPHRLGLGVGTVRRECYYRLDRAVGAAWFADMGLGGLVSQETRGFGWQRGPALDREAEVAGQIWLVVAATLGAAALLFKLT